MPLFDFACDSGHTVEHYVTSYAEAQNTAYQCTICQRVQKVMPSFGGGLLWMEEGRPRTFYNMGDKPVTVSSRRQYREALRKHNVLEGAGLRTDKSRWI